MLSLDLQEITIRQLVKMLKVFMDAGITPNMLAYLRKNEGILKKIKDLIIDDMMPYKADQELFSCLKNEEFFGLSDWKKIYNLDLGFDIELPIPIKELEVILESPCPFTGDKKVRETHFLFYLPDSFKKEPLTIKKLMEMYPIDGDPRFYLYMDKCHGNKRSLLEKGVARFSWYLMYKGIIPGSEKRTWAEQLALKPRGYDVARLIECTAMHFLLYEKNRVRVDETKWGRTSDSGSVKASHFSAGGFSEKGFCISEDEKDSNVESNVGIYFFRKLEKK